MELLNYKGLSLDVYVAPYGEDYIFTCTHWPTWHAGCNDAIAARDMWEQYKADLDEWLEEEAE